MIVTRGREVEASHRLFFLFSCVSILMSGQQGWSSRGEVARAK